MPSPPKPWERAGAAAQAGPAPTASASTPATTTSSTTAPPAIPARPSTSTMNTTMTSNTLNRPGFGTGAGYNSYTTGTGYGSTYGNSYGGSSYGSYSSPYNRYGSGYGAGGYGSTYGSSYGGYGSYSPYNRYGSGYSPYNRFSSPYGPGPGGPGAPGEMPLSARMEQSTQATFNTLDQIVQAFGGFAQMLESTFMATHSSFMAMVGVAEQFGNLRSYFGQIFSLLSLYQAARRLVCRLTGRQAPVDASQLDPDEFKAFEDRKKASKKPIWVFLFFTIGIPWLISKLFQRLQRQRLEAAAAGATADPLTTGLIGPDGRPLHPSQIRDLEFCRAVYDFAGESPAELSLKKGDIVAVLSKLDPATGQPGMWWRGRLQSGEMGMFPSNYVEIIQKQGTAQSSPPLPPAGGPAGIPMQNVPVLDPAAFNPDAIMDGDFGPIMQ
ncbi:uncharacterized protein SPPG_03370 [Spizellomyces punctatus DAOM BR117]|uniref:Peroxisomal membrane protein PEX13 n=1 Tax=Spizellomyces punctatus (strain DAOM BR117) TaxID=645134 RepID=A0A0L0HL19_SPIPD|nr:uncharacterized protein SPPG_03370 [Spizellomyces punctatus DAOM BR117]KND01570.1 hypothetical protein SPPG_03370 [Spizellomyces punctatus DAOM BR117]|eukprot:XP_016609609.1 hypothetical protein SPPG_03370 [Spizellomyces punctatus DAOM BR117]